MNKFIISILSLLCAFGSINAEKVRLVFTEHDDEPCYLGGVGVKSAKTIYTEATIENGRCTIENFLNTGLPLSMVLPSNPEIIRNSTGWKSSNHELYALDFEGPNIVQNTKYSWRKDLVDDEGNFATPVLHNALNHGHYCDSLRYNEFFFQDKPIAYYYENEDGIHLHRIHLLFSGRISDESNEYACNGSSQYQAEWMNLYIVFEDETALGPSCDILVHVCDYFVQKLDCSFFQKISYVEDEYEIQNFLGTDCTLRFQPSYKFRSRYSQTSDERIVFDKTYMSEKEEEPGCLYLKKTNPDSTESDISISLAEKTDNKFISFSNPKIFIEGSEYISDAYYEDRTYYNDDIPYWDDRIYVELYFEGDLLSSENAVSKEKIRVRFLMPNLRQYRKSNELEYDGHYLTISPKDKLSNVTYTLSDGTTGSLEPESKIDLNGLNNISIQINNSDNTVNEYSFSPKYYNTLKPSSGKGFYDRHIYVSESGNLDDALHTCWGKDPGYWNDQLNTHLYIHGSLNEADYDILRKFADRMGRYHYHFEANQFSWIDITDVAGDKLPENAFKDFKYLQALKMPKDFVDTGVPVFGNNPALGSIEFSNENIISSSLIDDIANPNILIYAPAKESVVNLKEKYHNLIIDGVADEIVLNDEGAYFCPVDFQAGKISYTKDFSKVTGINGCSGWEALVLPFDVESIELNGKILSSFATEEPNYDNKFWLYRRDWTGWEATDRIQSNKPYLIAMPNNPAYLQENNLTGQVKFVGMQNANIQESLRRYFFYDSEFNEIWAMYHPYSFSNNSVYFLVNSEEYDSNPAGGIFANEARNKLPFEWYIYNPSGFNRRAMPIFTESEVSELLGESDIEVWTEGHDLCILSGRDMQVRVHDLSGCLVSTLKTQAGVTGRVSDLKPGIYFAAGKKVLVK